MKNDLTFFLVKSFAFHFLLMGAIIIIGKIPTASIWKERWISSAVRVDMVGMPDWTLKELRESSMTPSANTQELDKGKNSMGLQKENSKEGKKIDLQGLLKSLSKKNSKAPTATGSINLKGNQISSGSSLSGNNQKTIQGEWETYITQMPGWIRPFWKLPTHLQKKGLKCRIQIYLSSQGKILRLKVLESSGDPEYDKRALSSIENAAPFAIPASSIRENLFDGRLVLGFPL